MSSNGNQQTPELVSVELVNVEVDGKPVKVAKGANLIKAAKAAGVDVPFYCYHPHLSVPGNCRMCQVEVVGAPKLMIGCHTVVQEGMKINTQETSQVVKDAQAATLEFILINHPLDCTVCDQAGHCKLQDYHYEYNARPSRFLETKVNKVKAEPLGPTVMLDGERCIMCTRCIRFCDEVTKTSELGMLNRGDRSVISINPGKELNNPLSGTVVDLCPVGALTHKKWRFNTRIWYTKQTDSICPGCSTGCNVKVAERDGQVVQVKARMNDAVNKEWLCDEGRYGFDRFLPAERVTALYSQGVNISWAQLNEKFKAIKDKKPLVLLSPDLTLETYLIIKQFLDRYLKHYEVALAYKERSLTETEAILISPDYAANFRGAQFAGLAAEAPEKQYSQLLARIKAGHCSALLLIGDRAIDARDLDVALLSAISQIPDTIGILTDASGQLSAALNTVVPGRSILESSGCMVNRDNRMQYTSQVVPLLAGTEPAWRILANVAADSSVVLADAIDDRSLTNWLLRQDARLSGLTIRAIKAGGIDLNNYKPATQSGTEATAQS